MQGAAALLLCASAGCADVDLDTSVTEEALSSPTVYPVFGTLSFNPEDPTSGPMVAVADLNNDGNPDLAIENDRFAVMVRLGDGAGGFGAERRFDLNIGDDRPNAIIAKDLNADGKIDVVTANDASLSVLMGNGDGTLGPATTYAILPSFSHGLGSVTAVDLSGDGKLDLATGMKGGVGVLLGNGDGTFGARTDLVCDGNINHNSVTAADFNLDGKLDLASAGSFTSSVYLFPGNGDGTFAACTATTVGTRPQSMTTGDFNRDGKPDLATANSWGISVTVLLNQLNGTFARQDYPFKGQEFDMLFVGAAHVDTDSSLDLLVGHQLSLFVMSGNTDGTFEATSSIALPKPPRFAVTGHFDHDPLPRTDLLVSLDDGDLVLLRGDTESAPCTSGCTPFVVGSTQADGASLAPGPTEGLKISRPSSLRAGDVLYAFITKSDDVGAIVTPEGWTQLGQFVTTDGDDFTTGLWRRVVTSSSETQSERFTHTDGTAEAMSGYIVAVRGANPVTPEDAPVGHASGLNSTFPSSPSVTTTSPWALVLRHEGLTGSAAAEVVAPFPTTLLQSTEAAHRNSGVSAFLQAAPGPTATGQWRNFGASSGADFHTLTVAVRPL